MKIQAKHALILALATLAAVFTPGRAAARPSEAVGVEALAEARPRPERGIADARPISSDGDTRECAHPRINSSERGQIECSDREPVPAAVTGARATRE
jgi:hypothetical protein